MRIFDDIAVFLDRRNMSLTMISGLRAPIFGKSTTEDFLAVQKHIYDCPAYLKHLIEVEMLLRIADAEARPHLARLDTGEPWRMPEIQLALGDRVMVDAYAKVGISLVSRGRR